MKPLAARIWPVRLARTGLACVACAAAFFPSAAPASAQMRTSRPAEGGASPARDTAGAGRHTAQTIVLAPEYAGAFLSLGLPGAAQLYLGNPVAGGVYLGLASGAGVGVYTMLQSQLTEYQRNHDPGSATQALIGVASAGTFFAVGGISTLHALFDIAGRYAAADAVLVGSGDKPAARPGRRREREE